MHGRKHSERWIGGLVAGFLMLGAGCTSSDGSDSTPATVPADGSVAATTPSDGTEPAASSCTPEPSETPTEWPYAVPTSMLATAFAHDGDAFTVAGVTDDAEAVLVDAIDESFPDYDVAEPTGGALDLNVAFSSLAGDATLTMADDDADGCWDVTILATLSAQPDESAAPNDPAPIDSTPEPIPAGTSTDPLGDLPSVGNGQVTTARGTFAVTITACRFSPTAIDGQGEAGVLHILRSIDSTISVSWTYAEDGVEVRDDDARVLAVQGESGTFIADGENQDGPETIIAEITC